MAMWDTPQAQGSDLCRKHGANGDLQLCLHPQPTGQHTYTHFQHLIPFFNYPNAYHDALFSLRVVFNLSLSKLLLFIHFY